MSQNSIHFSVIIPLYNEEDSLVELTDRLTKTLGSLARGYEIIFVNDGSTDGSKAVLEQIAKDRSDIQVVTFRRNFGKAVALDKGFRLARGEIILTLDADLQDQPEEIPKLLAKLDQGYDLVSGWKSHRKDPLGKTFPSKIFNWVVSRASGLKLHDFNCGFKAYRRECLKEIKLYGELHRFIPVFVHAQGFRVTEESVNHSPRIHGKSKYGWGRLWKGFFDLLTVMLITKYESRPLHFFGALGMLVGGIGFAVLTYLSVLWFLDVRPIGTRPLFFFGILCFVVGIQFVSTGLLGELIKRKTETDPGN